jgi:hypothetical protein
MVYQVVLAEAVAQLVVEDTLLVQVVLELQDKEILVALELPLPTLAVAAAAAQMQQEPTVVLMVVMAEQVYLLQFLDPA